MQVTLTLLLCLPIPVFEPAQLPQGTICPSVAFAKGQIVNSRGQRIIYYNIKLSLSYPINFLSVPKAALTLHKICISR